MIVAKTEVVRKTKPQSVRISSWNADSEAIVGFVQMQKKKDPEAERCDSVIFQTFTGIVCSEKALQDSPNPNPNPYILRAIWRRDALLKSCGESLTANFKIETKFANWLHNISEETVSCVFFSNPMFQDTGIFRYGASFPIPIPIFPIPPVVEDETVLIAVRRKSSPVVELEFVCQPHGTKKGMGGDHCAATLRPVPGTKR